MVFFVHANRNPTVSATKAYRRVSPRELIEHTLANPPPTKAALRAVWQPNPHAALTAPARGRVLALLRDLRGELALLGVVDVGVFGSVARGDDTRDSDVDLAVRLACAGFPLRVGVREFLERHFDRHVDLVPLPFPPLLRSVVGDDLIMAW